MARDLSQNGITKEFLAQNYLNLNPERIKEYAQKGANLDALWPDGATFLQKICHLSADDFYRLGGLEKVKAALENKANPNIKDHAGWTIIDYITDAGEDSSLEKLKAVLPYINEEIRELAKDNYPYLKQFIDENTVKNENVVTENKEFNVDSQPETINKPKEKEVKMTPEQEATETLKSIPWVPENIAKIRECLAAGADINTSDEYGNSLLATFCTNTADESTGFVEELLKRGANPNSLNSDGIAPINEAVAIGSLEKLKLLANNKADFLSQTEENLISYVEENKDVEQAKKEQIIQFIKETVASQKEDRNETVLNENDIEEGSATSSEEEEENIEEGTATSPEEEEENIEEGTPTSSEVEEEDIIEDSTSPDEIHAYESEPAPAPVYRLAEKKEQAKEKKSKEDSSTPVWKRVKGAFKTSNEAFYKAVFETSYKTPEDFADAVIFNMLTYPLNTLEAYLSKTYDSSEKDYLKEILNELRKNKQDKAGNEQERIPASRQDKALAGLVVLLHEGNEAEFEKMYAALGKREGITPDEVKDFLNKNPDVYKKFKSSMAVIAKHPFGRKLLRDLFPSGYTGKFTHDDLIGILSGKISSNREDFISGKASLPGHPGIDPREEIAYLKSVNERLFNALEISQKALTTPSPVNVTLTNVGNSTAEGGKANISGSGNSNATGGTSTISDSVKLEGGDTEVTTGDVDTKVAIGDKKTTEKTVTLSEKEKTALRPTTAVKPKPAPKPIVKAAKKPTVDIKPKQVHSSKNETETPQKKRIEEITTSFYAKIDSLKIKNGEKEVRKDMFIQLLSQHKKQMGRFEQAILLQQKKRKELSELRLKKKDHTLFKEDLSKAKEIDKDLNTVYLGIRLNELLMKSSSLSGSVKKKEMSKTSQKQSAQKKGSKQNNIAQQIYRVNVGDSYN